MNLACDISGLSGPELVLNLGFEQKGTTKNLYSRGRVSILLNTDYDIQGWRPGDVELQVYGSDNSLRWSAKFTAETPRATLMAVLATCPREA